jgi:putative MATE family efflux protein
MGRLLVRMSAPAIAGMLVNSLYNVVDTIFVGQGVGTLALAALAVCFPVQLFRLAVAQTIGIGSASVVSRALGAGDGEKAERVASGAFTMIAVVSLTLTVAVLLFITPILRLFGASEAVLPYGKDYLSVIFLGSVFFGIAVSTNNLVRSEGNARTAMFSMMLGAGVNIVLDPIFIFALKMGIQGAAVATVIGQFCAFSFLMRHYFLRRNIVRIRRKYLIPTLSISLEVLRVGSASFARIVAASLLAIVMNRSILRYGQDLHIAIQGVINRMIIFSIMPIFGLVQGLQPIIGYNYGAKLYGRVREALKYATLSATALVLVVFLVLQIFPRQILSIFSSDPQLIAAGVPILRIIVAMTPLIGFQIVGSSMFQALGKAGEAFILSVSRQILFFVPLILILPRLFSSPLNGIWVAAPGADLLSALLTAWFFTRQLRRMQDR